MLNSDYTESTSYKFYNQFCLENENVNIIGEFPSDKLEKVLSNPSDADKWTEFSIPQIFDIPTQNPDIEGIVEISSAIEIISQRVVKTPIVIGYNAPDSTYIPGEDISNAESTNLTGRKLIVEGILRQKIIYTAEVDEQSIHSANFDVPFSAFIIIDKDTPLSQKFRITPYIEDIFVSKLSQNSVFENTTIFIKASKVC